MKNLFIKSIYAFLGVFVTTLVLSSTYNAAAMQSYSFSVKPGYNLVSLPVRLNDSNIQNVLGTQLSEGSKVYTWNLNKQEYSNNAVLQNGEWKNLDRTSRNSNIKFKTNSAFWVFNNSNETVEVTVNGSTIKQKLPKLRVANGDSQLMGASYLESVALNDLPFNVTGTETPTTAEKVYYFNADTQEFESAWFCGGSVCESWGEAYSNQWLNNDYSQSQMVIQPFTGFIFRSATNGADAPRVSLPQ